MENLAKISCAGCGWEIGVGQELVGNIHDEPDAIARTAAAHLRGCASRWRGHPAFGFEPRWSYNTLGDGKTYMTITWTGQFWGYPFHLDQVEPEKKNLHRYVCHNCKHPVWEELHDRTHVCANCGKPWIGVWNRVYCDRL